MAKNAINCLLGAPGLWGWKRAAVTNFIRGRGYVTVNLCERPRMSVYRPHTMDSIGGSAPVDQSAYLCEPGIGIRVWTLIIDHL